MHPASFRAARSRSGVAAGDAKEASRSSRDPSAPVLDQPEVYTEIFTLLRGAQALRPPLEKTALLEGRVQRLLETLAKPAKT